MFLSSIRLLWYNRLGGDSMTVADMALRDALADCRRAQQVARRYAERTAEMSVDGLKSPSMDAGPKGGGHGQGAARAIGLDALRRMADAAASEATIAAARARRILKASRINGARLLFLTAYYVEAQDMRTAAQIADRSGRQCWRYIREIFGAPARETLAELEAGKKGC